MASSNKARAARPASPASRAKSAVKPAPKKGVEPAPKAPRRAAKAAAQPALTRSAAPAPAPTRAIPVATPAATEPKARKPKLVRDSFTIPKDEYAAIDVLKARSARLGRAAKKSEVLRAGLKALSAMPDSTFVAALREVPAIKTGRPASK